MKREYFFVFGIVCLFIFIMRPIDNFKPDTLLDLTRDQISNAINNEGHQCDYVALIKRNKNNIKIGCAVKHSYFKYEIYKDEYGFNKVRQD